MSLDIKVFKRQTKFLVSVFWIMYIEKNFGLHFYTKPWSWRKTTLYEHIEQIHNIPCSSYFPCTTYFLQPFKHLNNNSEYSGKNMAVTSCLKFYDWKYTLRTKGIQITLYFITSLLLNIVAHSWFNSYTHKLVPIFYSAIKHGYRCFIN